MFESTNGVEVDSPKVDPGRLDDTSCTTDEVVTNDEATASGIDVNENDKTVDDSTALDEDKEAVVCAEVLDATFCVGVDRYEDATGSVDDTSCTTEKVDTNDDKAPSGADVDEVDKGVLKLATVDGSKEIVGCANVLDDTIGIDVDSSVVANGALDVTS